MLDIDKIVAEGRKRAAETKAKEDVEKKEDEIRVLIRNNYSSSEIKKMVPSKVKDSLLRDLKAEAEAAGSWIHVPDLRWRCVNYLAALYIAKQELK